ncbi:hypothetical protein [Paraburkholderia terrae]|uniref:Uncharacterized protein n=1 Tax=Paraburkholderia terrae TaxID=311230 RepID=A0A2I8EZV8_9BURK|nr:hypothetical protein [Paraburkholderia terrae]AUT65029.1 hypothetical protein C2L65_36175 [Paraburkholderia terrae]
MGAIIDPEKGAARELPLERYDRFDQRDGTVATTIQINQRKDGSFAVGVFTDVTDALATSREAYQPRCEALALDLGLNTLFATDQSDLIDRQWQSKLEYHDRRHQPACNRPTEARYQAEQSSTLPRIRNRHARMDQK